LALTITENERRRLSFFRDIGRYGGVILNDHDAPRRILPANRLTAIVITKLAIQALLADTESRQSAAVPSSFRTRDWRTKHLCTTCGNWKTKKIDCSVFVDGPMALSATDPWRSTRTTTNGFCAPESSGARIHWTCRLPSNARSAEIQRPS
jgi:hypothetical protein